MRDKWRRAVGLFVVSLMVILLREAPQQTVMAAEELTFSLVFEKQEHKPSEPIEVRFKLQNRGKKTLTVNTRFKLGSPQAAPDQREVFLEARSPSGAVLPAKFPDGETGLPKSEYFQLLEPGAEAISERKWDVRDYFDFKEPGAYTLTATYENVFGKEIGIDAVKERYTTQTTLKIVEEK